MAARAADIARSNELINDRLDIFLNALANTDQATWQRLSRERPTADDIDTLRTYEAGVRDVLRGARIIPDATVLNREFLDRVLAMASSQFDHKKSWGPLHEDMQVQNTLPDAEYFETVLRGAPSTAAALASKGNKGYHFANNAQLGHIRGSIADDMSMLLHEVQSDPLEVLGATHPAMQNIYGKLGNMAVDRAAAAGINELIIPNGKRITAVRDPRHAKFYEKLYDDTLRKNLYDPLHAQGLRITSGGGYNTLHLPAAAREDILSGKILRYKKGGLAQMCECGK